MQSRGFQLLGDEPPNRFTLQPDGYEYAMARASRSEVRHWRKESDRKEEKIRRTLYRNQQFLLFSPQGKGYGHSDRWPFDIERAQRNPGYARGINRAIQNPRFHYNWRAAAKHDMRYYVVPYVQMLAEELEAAHTLAAQFDYV